MTISRTQEELLEALFARSIPNEVTGCLLWQGPVAGKGYGITCWQGKQVYIHRIAYHFANPTEKLDVIRHTCDTPNCWAEDHLRNGTTADNVADKIAKGRMPIGESLSNTSKFTEEQIREIRSSQMNLYAAAAHYGCTASNIYYIRARKSWKHVA